jgi:hypothetical protein
MLIFPHLVINDIMGVVVRWIASTAARHTNRGERPAPRSVVTA